MIATQDFCYQFLEFPLASWHCFFWNGSAAGGFSPKNDGWKTDYFPFEQWSVFGGDMFRFRGVLGGSSQLVGSLYSLFTNNLDHLEEEQPQLGDLLHDLLTMVIHHLLTGMILPVIPSSHSLQMLQLNTELSNKNLTARSRSLRTCRTSSFFRGVKKSPVGSMGLV